MNDAIGWWKEEKKMDDDDAVEEVFVEGYLFV